MHVHMMTECSRKHGEEDCSSACPGVLSVCTRYNRADSSSLSFLFFFENRSEQFCFNGCVHTAARYARVLELIQVVIVHCAAKTYVCMHEHIL